MEQRHFLSRFPGPPINPVVENSEEPLPSLSDLHDFEPKLEFDDTELLSPPPIQSKLISKTKEALCTKPYLHNKKRMSTSNAF